MDHKIINIKNAPLPERKAYDSKFSGLSKIAPSLLMNKIYMDIEFDGKKELRQGIRRKWTSYQAQDKKKNKYDKDKFIPYDELIELLVASQMRCHYCRHDVQLY